MVKQPLQDLKVLDLSWVVAGPATGRVFADYGATVIRVESSKRVDTARLVKPYHRGEVGIENSACFENVNAGKLGIALDMSLEESRDIVVDLVQWADVVVESFSPGIMERWGLDYENLKKVKPDLIMLSSSLMGQTGPYSRFAGFGNIGAAMSGFQNLVGWQDLPPKGPFGPYTDYIGPRFSLITILAALDHRRRKKEGCYIDLSQVETGIHFMAPAMLDFFQHGAVVERMGNQDLQYAPHGVYPCKESDEDELGSDAWVAIVIRDDEEWERFSSIVGGEGLVNDDRFSTAMKRLQYSEVIDEIISEWTLTKTNQEVETVLQKNKIAAHIVSSSADALRDEQLIYREHFIELDHPLHEKTIVEGTRFKLSRTPGGVKGHAPLYGQHKDYILRDILDYSDEFIQGLEAANVFK